MASYIDTLRRWEGLATWMYRDVLGNVTTGVGNLIADAEAAVALPWRDSATGEPLADDGKREAFAEVAGAPVGHPARYYERFSRARLTEWDAVILAQERMVGEFLPALRSMFSGFDSYPEPAREALVDLAYNLGAAGLSRFQELRVACEAGNWDRAAFECHVRTSRPERNAWRASRFADALHYGAQS